MLILLAFVSILCTPSQTERLFPNNIATDRQPTDNMFKPTFDWIEKLKDSSDDEFLKQDPELKPKEQYSIIENLGQHLQPFERCLIRIQNHKNMDIPPPQVPLLLSYAVFEKESNDLMTKHKPRTHISNNGGYFWSAKSQQNSTAGTQKTCTSYLFQAFTNPATNNGECLALKYILFTTKSKPWRCEAIIDIFPPNRQYAVTFVDLWYKPESWDRGDSLFVEGYKQLIPSPIPPVNIRVVHCEDRSKFLKGRFIIRWVRDNVFTAPGTWHIPNRPGQMRSKLHMTNDIYILMLTSNCKQPSFYRNRCNVTQIVALKPYFKGWNTGSVTDYLEHISETEISLSTLLSSIVSFNLTSLFFLTRRELLAIGPIAQQQGEGTFQLYLEMCNIQTSFLQLQGNTQMNDRFSLVLVHILQSVVQNSSYIFETSYGTICKNGVRIASGNIQPPVLMDVIRRHMDHNFGFAILKMADTINTPAFVSCGKPKMSGFAFSELLIAFHHTVWGFIVLSILLLATSAYLLFNLSLNTTQNRYKRDDGLFSIINQAIKPLVEQGDPFKSIMVAETSLRLCISAYLLVGIVLSNAYKNTNVYNMISPRQPVPYENMSQLMRDNFAVYSRGTFQRKLPDPKLRYFVMHKRPVPEEIKYDDTRNYIIDGLNFAPNFNVVSEIWNVVNVVASDHTTNLSKGEIELYNQLKDNVTLIPGLDSIIRNLYDQLWPENKIAIVRNEWTNFLIAAENYLNKMQNNVFDELMDECNNAALILPRVEANRLARSYYNKYLGLVNVGKENYYGWEYLIYFIGHVPPFLVDGIGAMQRSGIASKLVEFAASTYKPAPMIRRDPTKATMQGNIAIIFLILLVGLAIAFLAFLAELLHTNDVKTLKDVLVELPSK
ncbi:unnamed protein product [Orchesella dallaii]|uniref:Uncharacterized protein n=1 Tax=Orchesella dallaii TaxID=48710 RepID=A0ABP1Q0L5_9HEXA